MRDHMWSLSWDSSLESKRWLERCADKLYQNEPTPVGVFVLFLLYAVAFLLLVVCFV